MRRYYVYILHCRDGSYYTGVTNNVQRRFHEHASGMHPTSYTFKRRPLTLIYHASFRYVLDAIAFEKQVKRWSRKKKQALIRGDYTLLRCMSRNMYRKRIEYIRQQYRIDMQRYFSLCRDCSHPSSGSG